MLDVSHTWLVKGNVGFIFCYHQLAGNHPSENLLLRTR